MKSVTRSMRDLFAGVSSREEFSLALRDFIDRFRDCPDGVLIADEPTLLAAALGDDGLSDAWLASTAAWLARRHGLPVPSWARGHARCLARPWFAAKTHKLRMLLLQDSPTEFRIRNLFVSADAIERV